MSVLGNSLLLGAEAAGPTAYQVSRSLRFNSPDSSTLSKSFGSAGNRKTWTWSAWVKRSKLGTFQRLFAGGGEASLRFEDSDTLRFSDYTGSFNARLITTAVYRDPSAWYHIVLSVDTANGTAADRIKIYVNGTRETSFSTQTNPSQNLDTQINTASSHTIGSAGGSEYFDGYMADIWFLDGIAATPSDFAETDSTTGQWVPKLYSGSYGTNGFKLNFSDNSNNTATTLGKDTSGNSNNWTPNNFSVGNTKTIQVGTPSYPSAFTTTGNKTSDQTALSYVYWGGTYTGAATKIFRASDVSVFSTTIDVSGPSLDRYLWYSDDAINWTYIGNLASLSRPYTLSGYKYYATSEGSNSATITVGALPAGNDSLVDTPTSYGTDAQNGGEVRGNYSTFNPLSGSASYTYSNGNLDLSFSAASDSHATTTITVNSGVWYCEGVMTARGSSSAAGFCVLDGAKQWNSANASASGRVEYRETGEIIFNGSVVATVASYTTNDVIGIWIDATNNEVKFYKNNSLQRTQSSLAFGSYMPGYYANGGANRTSSATINTGQRAFSYSAPLSGKALCDTNLPAPVIAKPNEVMDVKLYTGNGSTQTISGLGFSPDFVWIKDRSQGNGHGLFDVIRGATKGLFSNLTNAEITDSNSLTSFDATGFSTGSGGTTFSTNINGNSYVGWAWDAGTSTVTNTQGSITSSVRANASAGFSVVTYTGNGANATVGHGLGVAPALIITKSRNNAYDWTVYHSSLGINQYLFLNSTAASTTNSGYWNTAPTSTIFGVGNNNTGSSGSNIVAYCFAPVAGYSSFGSYTGNGSADGPFVYTGFRPRWTLIKKSSAGDTQWAINDSQRNTYNVVDANLYANLSNAENADPVIDFLSNGFKLRKGTASSWNDSGATYVYAAFAESPFQYARAR